MRKEILAEMKRLVEASRDGKFDIVLRGEGLSGDEAEALRMLNEVVANFRSAVEYDLMKYKLTSDALGIALWDMDFVSDDPGDPGNRLIWSQEARHLMGFSDERDFPNLLSSLSDRIHPDDRERSLNAFASHVTDKTGKTPFDVEYRLKMKDGQYRHFHSFGTTLRNSEGTPLRVAGAIEDIDEKKKMQESLQRAVELDIAEKKEFNRILVANAPVGVTIFDENFKFIDCNDNILKMFGGISREFYSEFFGSKAHSPEFQPDGQDSYAKAMDVITRTIKHGENIKIDWVHQMPDGQPLPVELTMMRIKQDNKYVGLAYVYDMRERTKLKEDLEAALHKAEDANRAKSDFLARMSHEIRTPMNAILGITEIQMRSGELSEDTEEALGKIYESGNLLMGIINDILDLSKIEAEKLEIVPVEYDIMSMVNDTAQLNRMRSNSELIGFDIILDENTPQFMVGDELRIKQILNNILSNAFKYTDKGKIEFSISSEPINQGALPEGGRIPDDSDVMLIFRVSDTGQGISKEQLDMLFTDYTRFNIETNRTTTGTGLGLSITKQLTEMMGGDVCVESELGKGSVFTVRLPQKRHGTAVCGAELAKKIRNVRFQSSSLTKRTQFVREYMPYGSVLVVDDVESNIYVTKGLLMPYGLNTDTASGGAEAVEKVRNGKVYDVIFMDHMMPGMDGLEATRLIRDMGYKAPIVALTANAVIGQSEMLLRNGFDGFISKPIDSRELNHILNELIRNKKPQDIVDAARREHSARQAEAAKRKHPAGKMPDTPENSAKAEELKRLITCDAEKAVNTLENIYSKLRGSGDEPVLGDNDIESYIITVHGMKSALAYFGEHEMSAVSQRLELAGKNRDFGIMIGDTPDYLVGLRSLIAKHGMKETPQVAATGDESKQDDADLNELREKMLKIKEACGVYNISAARTLLDELTQKKWAKHISDALGRLNIQLLHSSFEEAAETADVLLKQDIWQREKDSNPHRLSQSQ